jgi:lysozyme
MKKFFLSIFILLLIVILGVGYYLFQRKIYYRDFGILIPRDYTVHGIDVSRYQGFINWNQVAKMKDKDIQLKFAFIKATDGLSYTDIFFKINWYRCKQNGLKRGAYLYFHPSISGKKQALNFIKNVDLQKGDFAPVVDFEEAENLTKDEILKQLSSCLITLKKKYKCTPIIYANANFYEMYLQDDFSEYPIWIAHYNRLSSPRIKDDWQFWQHSCKGNVNGIKGDVDFNVFNGSYPELQEYCLE